MKKSFLFGFLMLMILSSCGDSVITIKTNVTWTDNTGYTATGDWYLGVWTGAAFMISQLEGEPFEIVAVTPGTNKTVTVEDDPGGSMGGSSENYTVAVFRDANSNGKYDDGEDITGMDSGTGEGGKTLTLDVEAYY